MDRQGISPFSTAHDREFGYTVARLTSGAIPRIGAAAGARLDEALLSSFLSHVERLSEVHRMLLALMADPMADPGYAAGAKKVYMGSVQGVVEAAHPDLSASPGVLDRLFAHLNREGLPSGSPKALYSAGGVRSAQTTTHGKAFLDPIRSPQT